jgi:hypothetical protein
MLCVPLVTGSIDRELNASCVPCEGAGCLKQSPHCHLMFTYSQAGYQLFCTENTNNKSTQILEPISHCSSGIHVSVQAYTEQRISTLRRRLFEESWNIHTVTYGGVAWLIQRRELRLVRIYSLWRLQPQEIIIIKNSWWTRSGDFYGVSSWRSFWSPGHFWSAP